MHPDALPELAEMLAAQGVAPGSWGAEGRSGGRVLAVLVRGVEVGRVEYFPATVRGPRWLVSGRHADDFRTEERGRALAILAYLVAWAVGVNADAPPL